MCFNTRTHGNLSQALQKYFKQVFLFQTKLFLFGIHLIHLGKKYFFKSIFNHLIGVKLTTAGCSSVNKLSMHNTSNKQIYILNGSFFPAIYF